jgi:hypothetical protein
MKKVQIAAFRSVLLTLAMLAASTAAAQQLEEAAPQDPAVPAAGESWSYSRATERDAELSISKQKAMTRGAQRMARLDAMRWYGFSGSRPTATAMPYTTMYSPAWQMPGGRPYAWYISRRPVVIINEPAQAAVYR